MAKVAEERERNQQTKTHSPSRPIIQSQLFFFYSFFFSLFGAGVCTFFPSLCKGLLLCYCIQNALCILLLRKNQPPAKTSPARFNDERVYIKILLSWPSSPFFPTPLRTHCMQRRVYLKKKKRKEDGHACKIFVCAPPPSSHLTPHKFTGLLYGNTLNLTNGKVKKQVDTRDCQKY